MEQLGGVPLTIRSDLGTENGIMGDIQTRLRNQNSNSSRPPFLVGKSTHNQRIEAWWSILRKQNSQYWIDFFGSLRDEGVFIGDDLDKDLIRFCFMNIIQVHF